MEEKVQIEINEAIINSIRKENIPMDMMGTVLLVLVALYEGKIKLLDHADDTNKERKMHVLYRQLDRKGLLEQAIGTNLHYRLTERGTELVEYIRSQYSSPDENTIKAEQLVSIAEVELESCEAWIDDYINLFPDLDKDRRMIRMHPHTAINKMNAFIKKFKYDKETILNATKMYLDQEKDNENYKYTKNSNNFISMNPSNYSNYESVLAAWCQRYLDEKKSGRSSQRLDTSFMDIC